MNIYKNLMFLHGHFTDPHMDEAHEEAMARAGEPSTPGAPAPRPWWQRWSRFGTAQPVIPGRQDACCQC